MNANDTLNLGLLLLRLLLAGLLLGHATQKLFGWFHGMGPVRTGAAFALWGFVPGTLMALVAGSCELVGLLSVGLGLLTPVGCAVLVGTMLVAAAPNARNGLWAHLGGSEVPVVYAGLATVLAFTGPGRLSLDHAFGLDGLHAFGWAVAAVLVGAAAAVPPLVRRRVVLARASEAAPDTSDPSNSHTEVTR